MDPISITRLFVNGICIEEYRRLSSINESTIVWGGLRLKTKNVCSLDNMEWCARRIVDDMEMLKAKGNDLQDFVVKRTLEAKENGISSLWVEDSHNEESSRESDKEEE